MNIMSFFKRHKFEFIQEAEYKMPWSSKIIKQNVFRCKKCKDYLYLKEDGFIIPFKLTLGCKGKNNGIN